MIIQWRLVWKSVGNCISEKWRHVCMGRFKDLKRYFSRATADTHKMCPNLRPSAEARQERGLSNDVPLRLLKQLTRQYSRSYWPFQRASLILLYTWKDADRRPPVLVFCFSGTEKDTWDTSPNGTGIKGEYLNRVCHAFCDVYRVMDILLAISER